jgi:catecholate siderophore receptor
VALMTQDTQTTRDVMENRDYGIAPSLRFGIGTPTEFTLSGLFLHNRDMPDYGVPPLNGRPVEVSRRTYYGLTDDRTIQDVASVSAQLRHRIAPGLTLRNQTRYTRTSIDARTTGPNSLGTLAGAVYTVLPTRLTGNTTAVPQSQLFAQLGSHDRQITDTGLYNQTDLGVEFATGSLRHTLVAGLELGRDTYRNQATGRTGLPAVSVNDPAIGSTPAGSTTTYGNLADATATTLAPYVNDTIEFNRHWKFIGGLRFDRYAARIANRTSAPASANQTVSFTSVRTGLMYQPTDSLSVYASYGTSFDPSLETLTVTNGTQALPPVKNRSHEAGVKWDALNGKLSLTGAVFRIEQTNARSQISPGVYELTGNVRVSGFELGAVGNLTRHWRVLAGYAALNAKIVQASALDGTQGNVPANTPRHSVSLWTSHDIARHWELGGGITHLSSRFNSNSNAVSVPGYTRIDAMLAWHQPKYDLRLNLLNLGNKYYYDTLIPSDGGRSVPGIGRTAMVTLAWRF